jgi:putative hydrolase of the HAD superfamily
MDVTGTLVSFRGTLEDHYLGAARKCGVEITDDASDSDDDSSSDGDDNISGSSPSMPSSSSSSSSSAVASPTSYRFSEAFRLAYKETSLKYPCFGADEMSAKEWWRLCVLRSFELAGAHLSEHQQDVVFQRIYSTFGSHAAYEVFQDALPFLRWAQRHGIVCGVLSNADERYGDSILPMLGLTPDELQFQCFSKDLGIEKPDARIFLSAMKHSRPWLTSGDALLPSEVLHIGNDFAKDFEGAKRAGMHTVLLDRYEQTELADEWKRRGAQVFQDLVDVVEFLGRSDCQLG